MGLGLFATGVASVHSQSMRDLVQEGAPERPAAPLLSRPEPDRNLREGRGDRRFQKNLVRPTWGKAPKKPYEDTQPAEPTQRFEPAPSAPAALVRPRALPSSPPRKDRAQALGTKILWRKIQLATHPSVPVVEGWHQVQVDLPDPKQTRFRFWLDPQVEIRSLKTPWEGSRHRRDGAQVEVELPYHPYRGEFAIEMETHLPRAGDTLEIPAEMAFSLEAGPLSPATRIQIRAPVQEAVLANTRVQARRSHPKGVIHEFVFPAGTPMRALFGPWELYAGAKVELFNHHLKSEPAKKIHSFASQVVETAIELFDLPDSTHLTLALRLPGFELSSSPGILILDPKDETWTTSYTELARRIFRILWSVPEEEGHWFDEALPAYLAEGLARKKGLAPSRSPRETFSGVVLKGQPKGNWEGRFRRWSAQVQDRGKVVLRSLRGMLGAEEFRAFLKRMHQGLPAPSSNARVFATLDKPEWKTFYDTVVVRGEPLDFKVEEIKASGAIQKEVWDPKTYRTYVRLRLGKGLRFRGPVPVRFLTERGKVDKLLDWQKPDTEVEVFTKSRVRKVLIDPQGWYPDPRRKNNLLAFQGDYRKNHG